MENLMEELKWEMSCPAHVLGGHRGAKKATKVNFTTNSIFLNTVLPFSVMDQHHSHRSSHPVDVVVGHIWTSAIQGCWINVGCPLETEWSWRKLASCTFVLLQTLRLLEPASANSLKVLPLLSMRHGQISHFWGLCHWLDLAYMSSICLQLLCFFLQLRT